MDNFCFRFILGMGLWVIALGTSAQQIYRTGSEEPVNTNHSQGILLAGGATDNDDAMRWLLEQADGGDVVVLRAGGSDGYNNYMYSELGVPVNSVTSIVIRSSEEASANEVLDVVRHAEVVFIAGGNQWNYVNYWSDSRLLDLLDELIHRKKISIGGTSAGMAVLGEVVFSAENNTVWSSEALSDPYHWRVMLEKDFLRIPFLEYTVTDTHYNREESDGMGRKGRHVGFLSRMVADWNMPARGIAANEYTAVAIDSEGKARVFGHPSYDDNAYFLQAYGGSPEVCESGEPLHWDRDGKALMVYMVPGDREGSGWLSLTDWVNGSGGQWNYWHVDEGELVEGEPLDDLEDGGWIQIMVRDADDGSPLEGASVYLIDHDSEATPNFGVVNFRPVERERQWTWVVEKDGYIPKEGIVTVEEENIALTVELTEGDTTPVTGVISGEKLTVYPVPAADQMHIESESVITNLQLIDLSGRTVYHRQPDSPTHSLETRQLPEGTYIIRAETTTGNSIQRVQIIRH